MENNLDYLKRKLALKQVRVKLRYDYYEQKKHRQEERIMPPWLKGMYESTVGWCGKAVDELSDRLVFLGFDENTDIYGTMDIFASNNPDVFFDSAIQEALIGSCAFAHVSHGDNGELMPKLSVLTALDATGIIDEQTYMLKEGYAILDRDKDRRPTVEAYFIPGRTEYHFLNTGEIVVEESECRYPLLVPIVYKPTAKRPFGHSRISRSCMYLQQLAENTLRRAEVSGEFYSFPQKYVVGTDPDLDPMDAWKASISAMLRFDKDADGDKPQVGQFSQQSMQPYTDQLRTAASMFAGETGLTLDDLGFVSDNPSSADAIKAAHDSLRVIARKAQRNFASAFANVGYVGACVRDNQPYSRSMVTDMKAKWMPIFEPDASMISTVGDAAIKVNQAVPGFFNFENLTELTGLESGEPVGVEETDDGTGE